MRLSVGWIPGKDFASFALQLRHQVAESVSAG